jgi:hypothetical protein
LKCYVPEEHVFGPSSVKKHPNRRIAAEPVIH